MKAMFQPCACCNQEQIDDGAIGVSAVHDEHAEEVADFVVEAAELVPETSEVQRIAALALAEVERVRSYSREREARQSDRS